jgi:hypothetical protein
MREVWVLCNAESGMFSDEYAVQIQTEKGKTVSLFAPKEYVQVHESPDGKDSFWIKAFEVSKNQVKFPVETFEMGTSAVSIPSGSIVNAGQMG